MSEFHFAVSTARISAATSRKRHAIARRVGGKGWGYTSANMPEGPRAWGYGPNLGEPFNSRIAREIRDAWATEGVGVD